MSTDLKIPEIQLLDNHIGGQFGFEMELSAAKEVGNYFEDYQELLENPKASPARKVTPCPVEVIVGNNWRERFFKRNKEKNVTETQRMTFEKWLSTEESQGLLLKCSLIAINNHFVSSYWEFWGFETEIWESLLPGDEIGDEVKPPEIPAGYLIQDFTRIVQLFISREMEVIGIILDAAWSENQIGVNFSPHQVHAGRDDIAWVV